MNRYVNWLFFSHRKLLEAELRAVSALMDIRYVILNFISFRYDLIRTFNKCYGLVLSIVTKLYILFFSRNLQSTVVNALMDSK